MRIVTKKSSVLATAVAVAVAGGGVAFAFVTGTGGGGGHANAATDAGTKDALSVTQAAVVVPTPGTPVAVTGQISNTKNFSVGFSKLTATIESTDRKPCAPENFQLASDPAGPFGSSAEATPKSLVVPGYEQVAFGGLSLRMVDDPKTDQTSCLGAKVSIKYTVS